MYLLLALLALPVLEIAVFIQVGGLIGLLPTLALIVLSAMAGSALLRQRGLAALANGREWRTRRAVPAAEAFDSLCVTVAGLLLLLPGFITDLLALLLLVPAVRAALRNRLVATMRGPGVAVFTSEFGTAGGRTDRPPSAERPPAGSGPTIIEGEFEEVDERPSAGSRWRPPGTGSRP